MQIVGAGQVTDIAVGSRVMQPAVRRFGLNLTNETYYDAGQMMKSLVFRNPGFEGEIYQSTIRCAAGSQETCVDDDAWSGWPSGFWDGATFEFFYGAAQGRKGKVSAYEGRHESTGGTFMFSSNGTAPATGDYMIVRKTVPGNATAGWWPTTSGNGAITTNMSDLPPGTTGLQTAAVTAPASSDSATVAAYFDRNSGRSFLLLNGTFQLSFKAKGTAGSNSIAISLQRIGLATYLNQTVALTNAWATYNFTFTAAESGSTLNAVALSLGTVGQDSFLIDDVSLSQTNSSPSNPTAFRDPVVATLQTLNPGGLRFWAGQLGDTLDNLIADPFGRQRAGYSAWYTSQDDISYGLHEFLQLCETIGAEPWFVVPTTFSATDAANLIEYLAGSSATPYGSKRAARGHANPWTGSFTKIHLEFGNEAWNSVFKGGNIEYSAPYGQRAQTIFGAMRGNAAYVASAFDLVLGGQAVWAGRNQDIQNHCNNNDSFAVAPYMMNTVNSFASNEDLFGSTFAEPEALVSPNGVAEGVTGGMMTLNQQAIQASSHPVPLVMYEMNLSTLGGSITQAALNSYVSSLGAGLAVADAMLQQMRQGVLTQNLWNLSQYNFVRPDGSTAYLWGAVVDMGVTNQRRPQFLALQLANQAIGQNAAMLQTVHSGADPTWNQPLVNTVQLATAHFLQSYAFSNSSQNSLVVFNLSRTTSLPVTFSGPNAPSGSVQFQQLTSEKPADTNEVSNKVKIKGPELIETTPSTALSLPPYSMTVLTWRLPVKRAQSRTDSRMNRSVTKD
jgi:alpha-L-arabinofuranosidase